MPRLPIPMRVCPATVTNLIKDYVTKGIDSIIQYNISPIFAAALRKADGRTEAELILLPHRTDILADNTPAGRKSPHRA